MSVGWRYFLRRILVSVVLLWVLSVITFAIYFTIRASQHQEQSFLHTVDAINRYNDEPACAPAVGMR